MIRPPAYIWRLTKHRDLSGRGGLQASGRWHTRPKPIVYCSENPSAAYQEIVQQVGSEYALPDSLVALKIKVPVATETEVIEVEQLDANWQDAASGWLHCQPLGDRWLAAGRAALLRVPCAVCPGGNNFLINPAHRDADALEIVEVVNQPFPDVIRRL